MAGHRDTRQPEPGIRLIAHRGASSDAPENTLAAIREALRQDACGIEVDVHAASCGSAVVCHDETPERTTIGDLEAILLLRRRRILESTAADLALLDAGSWFDPRFRDERLPTLSAVLEIVPEDRLLFVEWKGSATDVASIVPPLQSAGRANLRVLCFDLACLRAIRVLDPERLVRTHWLLAQGHRPGPAEIESARAESGFDGLGIGVSTCALDPIGLGEASGAWVDGLTSLDLELGAWTVDDPLVRDALVGLGIRSITTNRPGKLRAFVRESSEA